MRRVVLLFLLLALAAPASAPAALKIGIAENQPTMFSDPLFADLGVKYARVVVSWDVMTSGDDELQRVTDYLTAAQAQGVDPLVTFEHARGAAEQCNQRKNRRKRQCRLPSAREYERQFKRFRARFPLVRSYVAWNEINHFTQPTYRHPKAAAQFSRIARRNCRGCRIVVADILDRADNARAKKPRFRSTLRYIKRFRKALKAPRRYCGVHNYSDTNRFRDTRHEADHQGARLPRDLADRDRRDLQVPGRPAGTVGQAPAARDEVHVQARAPEQADPAALRLHVVRRGDAALRRRAGGEGQAAAGVPRGQAPARLAASSTAWGS